MRLSETKHPFLLGSTTLLITALAIAGCHQHADHADEKSAVTTSLGSNNLNSVSVSQDRDKGVMTLSGDVTSDDQRSQAETLAKQAAPDYTIADEIGVRPTGEQSQASAVSSKLDDGIEDNFKAEIKAHRNLDDQSIHIKAKNGTLVLSGSVKTAEQKREAESLAKKTPNVQQVVNELEVKPDKHSTNNS
ncbi:MAG TPA: BON domain-containing protein [Terracidiphilus sp.]|jgi:hyperosmotically inducible protein